MKITITVQDVLSARLKSQLYGLLCEYEKDRDWTAFLDSIIIELIGIPEEEKTASYYILFHKISSLRYLSYKYFRTTIFDCMNLISKEQQDG
jgi:hypothetical protein